MSMMSVEGDEEALLADLDAALDGTANETPAQREQAPEGETSEQKDERLYRRDGRRFVAKEEEKPADAKPDAAASKDAAPVTPAPVKKPLWYKDEYGEWDKLGEPLRKALETREKEYAQGIEKHSTVAKAWEPLTKALEPHMAVLQQAGLSPQQYYGELHQWNMALRSNDPTQQVYALDELAKSLNIDLLKAAEWLAANGGAPEPDPRDQRIAQLEQWKTQFETQQQTQQRSARESEIQAWAKDKPHFADVRATMAALAKTNGEATLDQLYEQAQWAHPDLRERILADQRKTEVTRARAAGAQSPRSGLPNGSAARTKPTMTLEEEIGSILDGGV